MGTFWWGVSWGSLGVSWGVSWVCPGGPGCCWVGFSWIALEDPQKSILKAAKNYRRCYDTLLSKNLMWRALVARGSFRDFLVGTKTKIKPKTKTETES